MLTAKEFGVIFSVERRAPMNPKKTLKERKGTNNKRRALRLTYVINPH